MDNQRDLAEKVRQVWREMKSVPVSKLRKGQLLCMLEVLERARDELKELPEARARSGPLGARPIPMTTMEIEGEAIRVPLFPEVRKKT